MTSFDVRVDTDDLRRAMVSVLPHVDTSGEIPALERVRVYVVAEHLVLAATDRFSAAFARVEVVESSGELGAFDLGPEDVGKVVGLFKVPKEMLGQSELRLQWDEKSVAFTDVSGMFDAEQSLGLPSIPVDEAFPDLTRFFHDMRSIRDDSERQDIWGTDPNFMSVNAKYLVRFGKAAGAYGEPLVIETVGKSRALLITCSSAFLGLLMPVRQDADAIKKYVDHRVSWFDEMPAVRASHPSKPVVATPEQLLFERARKLVVREQRCGRTFLCAELDITQRQARELLERLEVEGIVGSAPEGNAARQVLVSGPLFEDGAE